MKSIIEAKKQAKNLAKLKKLKLKEALEMVAKENDHASWKEFKNSIDTYWYDKASPFLTQWFTNHREAKSFQVDIDGFLLTYKGQYFVVDSNYIEFLGLDPENEVWRKINRDVSSAEALDKVFDYLKKSKAIK
ncbi:MAG: hypothetical protein VX642_11180 [Bdellovibrionota bacterium]|nr:hypothetical protein [Bdellovibrionota bacterium]